ncbi:hypothetical protein ABZ646_23780 [Streptomyces sp. NPDC007162]|uniref:hypothetical protein n=1 Tax=Streptomyces sp. NPDC007162 TaxID=3156917 RepID=UPI0033FCBA90
MSESTPSQAEGERPEEEPPTDPQENPHGGDVPRTTPSQAEGEDTEDTEDDGTAHT